jgi:hypothetical protein
MRPVSAGLLACALIPLSLGVTACEPHTVTDTSRPIYCEVMPDAPARDDRAAPKNVIGKVRFRCVEPGATSMTLALHLQRRNAAGAWLDVASKSFTATGADTVRIDGEDFRSREVSAGCSDGVFRVHVQASSLARGIKQMYERTSAPSIKPCEPSFPTGR